MDSIIKRNGKVVPFDPQFIHSAISRALIATNQDNNLADDITQLVLKCLIDLVQVPSNNDSQCTVEMVQNVVENVLMKSGPPETARAYIIYRYNHEKQRLKKLDLEEIPSPSVSEDVSDGTVIKRDIVPVTKSSISKFFQGRIHNMIVYYKTYSRRIPRLRRREHWPETVDRFMRFVACNDKGVFTDTEKERIHLGILNQRVMPSMRALQYSGPPADLSNIRIFNCSFTPITRPKDMVDIMNILMQGAGAGFSVEEKFISQFPIPKPQRKDLQVKSFTIPDSREGWCQAFRLGLDSWLAGGDVEFYYNLIRPCGSPLVTSGGTASGPEPLRELLLFSKEVILRNSRKRIPDIDLYDIVCYIGKTVVAGNTRRSAEIALFDFTSKAMMSAKDPENFAKNPQRCQANNSYVLDEIPNEGDFLAAYNSLAQKGMGEPGIFNRVAVRNNMPARRLEILGDRTWEMGTNPCGEIELQKYQFCNLTTAACRANSTMEELLDAQELSAMIGTFQATMTNFPGISKRYKRATEEERLLGCSLTGMFDCPIIWSEENLTLLKDKAVETNRIYAERFGIPASTAVTCVKPDGNTSETLGTSSGIHPRYAQYYIRRVRFSPDDAICRLLLDQGFSMIHLPDGNYVAEFPVAAPPGSACIKDVSVVEMFDRWLLVRKFYTEHNASVSFYVKQRKWLSLLQRIWDNIETVSGITAFPVDEHLYSYAPFEEITQEKHDEMVAALPNFDFTKIEYYERERDTTDVKREMACSGGVCYI